MQRRTIIAASLALPLLTSTWRAVGASDGDQRPFVLGTSTPGGGFALYGEVVERVLNARAGRAAVRAHPTNGTVENLQRLRDGTLDAALIQGTAASELFGRPDADGLRILFAMYPSPGMLAVPARSSIVRLEDARDRRIVFGVRTSGLVTLGRQVYAGIGIDIDRDIHAVYVDAAAESPRLVLAGDAKGLWGAGEGWPGFEALARSAGGARFIGPQPAQIAAIVTASPLLQPMEVAVGAYPGIDRPLRTVGSVNLILARSDLDVDRATRFVAAMEASTDALSRTLPQASFSTLAHTIASAPSPQWLHPAVGAASEARR